MRSKTGIWAAAVGLLACGGGRDDGAMSAGPGVSDPTAASSPSGASDPGTGDETGAGETPGETGEPQTTGVSADDGIFDVGAPGGDCPDTGLEFSYIWIANSPQGTISKINTETLVEEGRYYVRPDHEGSPSRTSVSLSGDVVVASRNGGLTKIYANPNDCGPGATSTGPGDIKPFPDPCVAWHTPFLYSSHRGVAFLPAQLNEETCEYEDEMLWSAGTIGTIDVALVRSDDGTVDSNVLVPGGGVGVYGAAVDGAGNFWGWVPGGSQLLFVDRATLALKSWPSPAGGYGITVDHENHPWLCSSSVARFDPVTETFQSAPVGGGSGGCMEDGEGTLWISGNGLKGVDIHSLAVTQTIPIPTFIKGVSIQRTGAGEIFVWGVTQGADAHKADPVTATWETYTGLTSPYTYSDMTGFGLSNVIGPPSG